MMKKRGFTLIELLVVIAIIAVLMGILMPALSRVREQARQQSCGTRVRQHVLGLLMYADDNNSKLPKAPGVGAWLQDVSINTVQRLLDSGMKQEMFYCPSNETHKKYMNDCWTFDQWYNNQDTVWEGGKWSNYGDGNFIVSGYLFLLQTAGSPRTRILAYSDDDIDKEWVETTQLKNPAARELVSDLTMGQEENDTKWGYNFGRVSGGLISRQIYDTTSHLNNDEEPAGWNVGFLDGHVIWRKWKAPEYPQVVSGKARPRFNASGPSCFW